MKSMTPRKGIMHLDEVRALKLDEPSIALVVVTVCLVSFSSSEIQTTHSSEVLQLVGEFKNFTGFCEPTPSCY